MDRCERYEIYFIDKHDKQSVHVERVWCESFKDVKNLARLLSERRSDNIFNFRVLGIIQVCMADNLKKEV